MRTFSHFFRPWLPAMALGLAASVVGAQASGASRGQDKLDRKDIAFMEQAAENNHAEIASSQLALKQSANAQVKEFAQQMVADHQKTGEELAQLAAAKGVTLPRGPSMVQKAKLKLLEMADGEKFDHQYSESWGVKAHVETVELFEKAAAQAQDPQVKSFAATTLPALQQHLHKARQLPALRADGRDAR